MSNMESERRSLSSDTLDGSSSYHHQIDSPSPFIDSPSPFMISRRKSSLADKSVCSSRCSGHFGDIEWGIIRFPNTEPTDTHNYAVVDSTSSMRDLIGTMINIWKLEIPRVILDIVSSSEYTSKAVFEKESQKSDLQIGIANAAAQISMWVMTEGLKSPFLDIIGEAAEDHKIRRKFSNKNDRFLVENWKFSLIGMVQKESLPYGNNLVINANVENMPNIQEVDSDRLETNHSHYILTHCEADESRANQITYEIRCKLISALSSRIFSRLKSGDIDEAEYFSVPHVGILFEGGPGDIDRVYYLLSHRIPVIVLKGKSEFASSLIADAFFERSRMGDVLYVEKILKPRMLGKVAHYFPELSKAGDDAVVKCRDAIFNCIKKAFQGNFQLLTLIDPKDQDLKDLTQYILTALILSQSHVLRGLPNNMINNLSLAVHWNCPKVASKLIFPSMSSKNIPIPHDLFFKSLIYSNRETFVDQFLEAGFTLSNFMNEKRETYLFDNLMESDFFVDCCLKPILGYISEFTSKSFLYGKKSPMSKILLCISGNAGMNMSDQVSSMNDPTSNEKTLAERRALIELICWSVITNRPVLARTLWRHTSEPIKVALTVSNMFYRLSRNLIKNIDLKLNAYSSSKHFSHLAIEMLTKIHSDSPVFAFRTLISKSVNFNNLTAMELAYIGNNKFFIAHPCCQAAVIEQWNGSINLRNTGIGIHRFRMPQAVKIFSCLFFVFPIVFWVNFDKAERELKRINLERQRVDRRRSSLSSRSDLKICNTQGICVGWNQDEGITFFNKIYYLWTAPISKFWLFLLFKFIFLFLFSYQLILPYCGSKDLTIILGTWNALLVYEQVLIFNRQKEKFPSINHFWDVCNILVNIYVTCLFFIGILRHLSLWKISFMDLKILQAFGITWYFYDALYCALPVSSKLGPMLVNITQMVRRDMIQWGILWSMCFISGGIAIYVTMFPLRTFDRDAVVQTLLTGLFSIFATPRPAVDKSKVGCEKKYQDLPRTCHADEINATLFSELEECPMNSYGSDLLVLQLQIITSLVFFPLMWAVFTVTIVKTRERSIEIWKFQFYTNVLSLGSRGVMPVPLSFFLIPYKMASYIFKILLKGAIKCQKCCCEVKNMKPIKVNAPIPVPYNLMKSYIRDIDKKDDEGKISLTEKLAIVEERFEEQKKMISRLHIRLIDAEQNQVQTNLFLEKLINRLEALVHKKGGDGNAPTHVPQYHSLARQSPYPGTDIRRFPVFEMDIDWTVKFEAYDPCFYSQPIDQYPEELQDWVERNSTDDVGVEESVSESPAIAQETPVSSKLTQFRKQSAYKLDSTNLPMNPLGRTGLRGRGSLCRYGPNILILSVITKWKQQLQSSSQRSNSNPDPPNILQVLIIRDPENPDNIHLPTITVSGNKSPYSAVCDYFDKDVLLHTHPGNYMDYSSKDMVEYFSQFASTDQKRKKTTHYVSHGYSATPIFRGYFDSPLNTDNAWYEAEIWNFHYKYKQSFDLMLLKNPYVTWVTASSTLKLNTHEIAAISEICDNLKARYV